MTRSCGNVFGLCGNALAALGVCVLAHCAAFAAPKSFDECIGTASNGGGWSGNVAYDRATGRAKLDARDHVFTPSEPSSKKFVTIEATATFPVNDDNDHPGADVQAAVRIAPNGKFQVWSKTGWLDVEAEGVTPVGGKEYTLRTTFDYAAGTYSVAIKNNDAWVSLHTPNSSNHPLFHSQLLHSQLSTLNSQLLTSSTFPLAAQKKALNDIYFDGKTVFRSLKGSQSDENPDGEISGATPHLAGSTGISKAIACISQTRLEFGRSSKPWLQSPSEFGAVFQPPPEPSLEFLRRFLPPSHAPPRCV